MVGRDYSKIVYILPVYDPATASHFFHIYELLAAASRDLDIFLVIERASERPGDFHFPYYIQRFSHPLLRFVELILVLARERWRGRRSFYTHYSYFGGIASWLVAAITGGRAYYWNCGMPWLYRRGRIEEAIFRFVLRHTIFVTGTDGIRSEYRRRYGLAPSRTRVLPNWINVERFRSAANRAEARRALGIPGDAKVVLFVHRLSRRKGAHLLPDIISGVLKAEKRAIFLIVGDGPEYEGVKRKAKSEKFESRVRMIGAVAHRGMPKYFAAADVFLMPSEEEGFPHVLLEAMALGIPFVASDVGGVREITPPELQRYVAPSGDASAFAARTLALLAQAPSAGAALAEAEQRFIQRYDTVAVLPTFIKFFEL